MINKTRNFFTKHIRQNEKKKQVTILLENTFHEKNITLRYGFLFLGGRERVHWERMVNPQMFLKDSLSYLLVLLEMIQSANILNESMC